MGNNNNSTGGAGGGAGAGDFSEPVEVCLSPDLEEVTSAMSNCITSLVGNGRNFPRPEQVVGPAFGGPNHHLIKNLMTTLRHKKMNESSVQLTDEVVKDTTERIHAVAERFYAEPTALLDKFDVLEELLSGREAERVVKAIAEQVGTGGNTQDSLEILNTVCNDLEAMMDLIKDLVPDTLHYPMVELRCVDLKEQLVRHVKALHGMVLEAVCEENRKEMVQIGATYNDIANTLVTECADSSELRTLQDFTNKAAVTLGELYDTYVNSCFERIRFALSHKHKLARDDIQIIYTTYNWPQNIQSYVS